MAAAHMKSHKEGPRRIRNVKRIPKELTLKYLHCGPPALQTQTSHGSYYVIKIFASPRARIRDNGIGACSQLDVTPEERPDELIRMHRTSSGSKLPRVRSVNSDYRNFGQQKTPGVCPQQAPVDGDQQVSQQPISTRMAFNTCIYIYMHR